MENFTTLMNEPKQRFKYQCLLGCVVWTVIITLLSCITEFHDLLVLPAHRIDNYAWWALQEWCLWYLWTPIIFSLLDNLQKQARLAPLGYLLVFLPVLLSTLIYQAIFDYFVYDDAILGTLVYFIPSHAVVLILHLLVWNKLWKHSTKETAAPVLLVDQGKNKTLLPFENIVSVSAASNYVEIHTNEQSYIKRATLTHLEQRLAHMPFIRTHRSYLVNVHCIKHIERKPSGSALVHLTNAQVIPLSKRYYQKVKSMCAGQSNALH